MTARLVRLLAAGALMLVGSGAARAEVVIGVAAPLTGPHAWSGEETKRGAEMAVADFNAKGGVLGQTVRLITADDACDPEQAVAVANKLVAEGVVLVVGHVCSGASIPAAKVYEAAGIPMISPASTNPALTDEGHPNVFRVIGRDDHQGVVAGNYLADRWGDEEIAILHDNQVYGEGLAARTREQLNARGVGEAMYRGFTAGERDYSDLIAAMRAEGIDVAYIGGYPTEVGLILRQARDQGYDLRLVSGDSLANDEFWLITGPAGEGTLFTFSDDPRRKPEAAPVVERFRAQGVEPEGYTLHTYAAIEAWAQAVEEAGTLDSQAVAEVLRGGKFDTVLGRIGFDEKGDITGTEPFVWYVWQDGEYVPADQQAAGR